MRPLFLSVSVLLLASPAVAQTYYAEQQYQPPQAYPQQQVSTNYNPATPAYNQPQYYAPAQPQQQATPAHQNAAVGNPDAGQSVMTDIRQMNF